MPPKIIPFNQVNTSNPPQTIPFGHSIPIPTIQNTPTAKNDFLNTASHLVSTIFPGQKIGESIGTLAGFGYTALKEKLGLVPKGTTDAYDLKAPSPLQVAGDIGQAALTIAAPEIGGGETVAGRIAANTALGAGIGATSALANKGNVIKEAGIGALAGGTLSGIAEATSALIQKLPTWFVKSALPKIKDKTIPYVLENTKLGTTASLLENSNSAVKNYSHQIDTVLSHPQYANEIGNGAQPIVDAMESLPNAQLDPTKIVSILKQVAPENKTIVEKLAKGVATLAEKNTLRQELDMATKKVFTDKPTLTFAKEVGHQIADALRSDVQTSAPETVPIFSQFSKELDLNKALRVINAKNNLRPTLYDIGAAYGGFQAGGFKGATEAILAERLLRSTGGKLAIAKGANVIAKTLPTLGKIGQAIKAPLIKAATQ